MNKGLSALLLTTACILLPACATVSPPKEAVEAPISVEKQRKAQSAKSIPLIKTLKRKVAIGRFSNETRYGRTFFRDRDLDPLGKQASEILAGALVQSGRFLVFERTDIEKINREQNMIKDSALVGVDTLILGSVTEFGRANRGKKGLFSSTKLQVANAKVDIRLVDVRTGHVFFSASGAGEATSESGKIAGFGSKADYDATLNDRAIAAAISDVMDEVVSKIHARPWNTDILKIDGNKIFISGGERQGIKVGDQLAVVKKGDTIKSQQTGFEITLPSEPVGSIKVIALFGESEANEGAIAQVTSGDFDKTSTENLLVELLNADTNELQEKM